MWATCPTRKTTFIRRQIGWWATIRTDLRCIITPRWCRLPATPLITTRCSICRASIHFSHPDPWPATTGPMAGVAEAGTTTAVISTTATTTTTILPRPLGGHSIWCGSGPPILALAPNVVRAIQPDILLSQITKTSDSTGKIYRSAHTLRTHLEDKHTVCPGYRCVLCGTVAKSRNSLHSHMSRQHRGISTKDLPVVPMPAPFDPVLASCLLAKAGVKGMQTSDPFPAASWFWYFSYSKIGILLNDNWQFLQRNWPPALHPQVAIHADGQPISGSISRARIPALYLPALSLLR